MKISDTYKRLQKHWNLQAATGEIPDTENPIFIFNMTYTKLLKQIAKGELDVQQLALLELEARSGIRTYYSCTHSFY